MIPKYVGSILPQEGNVIHFEGNCFSKIQAAMDIRRRPGDAIDMIFDVEERATKWPPCIEGLLLMSDDSFKVVEFLIGGLHEVTWSKAAMTNAEMWNLNHRGIHAFLFRKGGVKTIMEDAIHTASLFLPLFHRDVSGYAADKNIEFLDQYSQIKPSMKPRSPQYANTPLPLDESLIRSGDFFGIVRLDGLDTMLAWATGSTTGHTAVALRDSETGVLSVCESTTSDSYWVVNGVQCTEYHEWMEAMQVAGNNAVWAPLSPEYNAKFDTKKALSWFKSVEGFDYGYHNMLFSWIDTKHGNYPCIPPNYDICLEWMHLEALSGFFDRVNTKFAPLLWLEAFNKRVGTAGLHTLDVFRAAIEKGIDLEILPTIVEKDEWMYNTTRYGKEDVGPAMMCSSFVCNMWKAAGIFEEIGNDINCAEFTPYDVHALKIFDENFEFPDICHTADPENPLCQVVGQYTLHLNDFNTRPMQPRMNEVCPSLAPDYERPRTC